MIFTTINKPPTSAQTQVPFAAKWLGILGAVPFVFLATLVIFTDAPIRSFAYSLLATYGAIILSFLGGVHWGFAMADNNAMSEKKSTFLRLGTSVVPSIVGWCALLGIGPFDLVVIALSFCSILLCEWYYRNNVHLPNWYISLRWPLTLVVVACLTTAALV